MFTRFVLASRNPLYALVALAILSGACGKDSPTAPSSTSLKVATVSPASGSTTGGTIVTISGAGFAADVAVTVGGVPASQVTFAGSTTINAVIAGRPTAGAADVVVTSGGRSASLPGGFAFVAPSGANRPPVVGTIAGTPPRPNQPTNFGNLGEVITLAASVIDGETTPDRLSYAWSGPGTFSAQSAATSWTLPSTAATPGTAVATLTVTETFVEGNITHRNVSAPATFTLQLHDSAKEILDLGEQFLARFSDSAVPTATVMGGFSTTCDGGSGYLDESGQVANARLNYRQDVTKFRITRNPGVTLSFRGSCTLPDGRRQRNVDACASFVVHWEIEYIRNVDTERRIGTKEVTDGTDYVSAVLENNQWRLCHSDFLGSTLIPKLNLRRSVAW